MSKLCRFDPRVLGLAALLTFPAAAASAQHPQAPAAPTARRPKEFGTQAYTVAVIPASSFTSDTPATTDYGALYRYFSPADSAGGHFYSGVDVPAGAVIDFVGLETFSDGLYPYFNYQANLYYVDQHSGTTSGIVSVDSDYFSGYYTYYNPTALGWQLADNAHNALVMDVYQIPFNDCGIGEGCRENIGFRWVEIWWHRVVSPQPPAATFNDVPLSDFGSQYVEALAASGITGGCGGGNFCPDANLTRRQMAIFLSKALGLHWPN